MCEKANQKVSALARISKLTLINWEIEKIFYEWTINLLPFGMDVFFKGML